MGSRGAMWSVAFGYLVLLLLITQCTVAQQTNDPCAPGIPRAPGLICPDTVLGGTVGATGGIVATSTYSSCSAFQDQLGRTLDCGPDGQGATMTVLDLSLKQGAGQTVTYTFKLAKSAPAGGASTQLNPTSNGACTSGVCSTSSVRTVKIAITTSDPAVFYPLQELGLDQPYAVAPFHTNNFGDGTKPTDRCQSASSKGGSAPYKERSGSRPLTEGVVGWAGAVAGPMRPSTPGAFASSGTPYSWDMDPAEQFMGTACHQPLTQDNNYNPYKDGAFHCRPDANGYQCQAMDPNMDDLAGSYCTVDPKTGSNTRTMPSSPHSTRNAADFDISGPETNSNCYPFTDAFPYAGINDPDVRWDMCMTTYNGGRLNYLSPQLLWSGHHIYSGLVRNGDYYYQWDSKSISQRIVDNPDTYFVGNVRPVMIGCGYGCGKRAAFPSTNMLQPVPAVDGGEWIEGKGMPWPCTGSRRPGQSVVCSVDDEDCLGDATSIMPFDQPVQPSSTTHSASLGSVPMAVCSAQPSPPLGSIVGNIINKISNTLWPGIGGNLPQGDPGAFELSGFVYCSIDRIGIWETVGWFMPDWLANAFIVPGLAHFTSMLYYAGQTIRFLGNALGADERDQYLTADTYGTIGEPCKLYGISPGAIPIYGVRVVMTDAETGEVLEEIQLTNLPTLNLNNPDDAPDDTPQSTNTNTQQPDNGLQTVFGANRTMAFSIVGYETVNGKIAPDLFGAISVCNLTKDSIGLYQSDTDPIFGTPRNPWVYSNNGDCLEPGSNANRRCNYMDRDMCRTSGKVPLPQCLAARPPFTNASYNPYAWWYFIPPNKLNTIGEGCGLTSFSSSRLSEPDVAQLVCQSSRYKCFPYTPEGFDWTLDQRLTDQLNTTQRVRSVTGQWYVGANAQEKALRDALAVHSPCNVQGYFNEWQQATSCADFLSDASRQNYIPPNFAVYQGTKDCALPTYAVDGPRLLYFGNTQSNDLAAIRGLLYVSGTLVNVETSVSSGEFVRSTTPAPMCGVQQGGYGVAQFTIRNTGGLPGQYLVTSTCTNGIRQVGDFTVEIPAEGSSFVSVRMQQTTSTGTGLAPGVCTFNLTNPDFRTLPPFDQLQELTCSVLLLESINGTIVGIPGGNLSVCANLTDEQGPQCKPPNLYKYQERDNSTVLSIVLYVMWILFMIFASAMITIAFSVIRK